MPDAVPDPEQLRCGGVRHRLHPGDELTDRPRRARDVRATGVHVRTKDGEEILVEAGREVLLCAGAVDSPRLLLHSGIGPRADLEKLGRTSLTVRFEIRVGERLCCTVRTTYVCLVDGASAVWPDDLRARLEP